MTRDYVGMGHFNDPAHPEIMQKKIDFLEMRLAKLDALETAGVDNWEGYDEAMSLLLEDDDDSNC